MVMVDLVPGRVLSARSSLPTPLTRNFVASRNSWDGKMASEQRDKPCAVALDPAGELKLEQDRSYYAGRTARQPNEVIHGGRRRAEQVNDARPLSGIRLAAPCVSALRLLSWQLHGVS